ncbi:unnamed protein product [Kluyveromyces dobzhanskii CBS 2104]|uniref:Spindle pole body component 110 n=1 Tax=Kluyveromyces dobzhanskii CBS 2104 TaxID=1427455 RepID=A0A0A8L828_9SACH|nr:unnamed protein product [Kluyveromyces dobzhanskii CBS 2104]
METPHAARMKDYEFTPIGYVDEKRREGTDLSKENGLKRSLEAGNDAAVEKRRARNPSVVDETFNSTRLFNDTSFDETVPEAVIQERRPNSKKNLMGELLTKDQDVTENLTSNPLKETESSLKKLQMDNYNLRIKCTSLLKFLNNISDDGQIAKNLEILDELHDLKVSYRQLNLDYTALKNQFDNIEDHNDEHGDFARFKKENEALKEELRLAKESLMGTDDELQQLKDTIKSLESKVFNMRSEQTEKERQHAMKVDLLQSKINETTTSLTSREKECTDLKEKIKWLTSQLHEFDHQSGSLLDLQSIIDSKNEAIRNLETQLQRNEHQRQSLEREVSLLQEKLSLLRDTQQEMINHKDEQIKELTDNLSSKDSDAIKRLNELSSERLRLLETNRSLEFSEQDLKQTVLSLEGQLHKCQEDLNALRETHKEKTNELLKKQVPYTSSEVDALRHELLEMRKRNDMMKTENNSLTRRLDNLIRQSPTKRSVEVEINKKNNEINTLHSTIKDLEQELQEARSTVTKIRENHKQELENCRKDINLHIPNNNNNAFEVNEKLQNKVSLLQMELNSIKDTKEKELAMWRRKYESIRRSNEELLQESKDQSNKISNIRNEKDKEILQIQTQLNSMLTEKNSLLNELSKVKSHKDDYKEELKKTQSRLEFITKEFVKLKDASKQTANFEATKDVLNNKWYSKYQTMKNKFLSELKSLQDENLELQKSLLKQKSNLNSKAGTFTTTTEKGTLQDEIDYYRLKYSNEVKQNNDLKVMNQYLNRVLKASSQHIKLDILRLQNEVPAYNNYADIPFHNIPSPRHRLKFKTVALMVLSCIRVKSTIETRRWDRQRIDYLKRKIVLNQDKISW